VIGISEQLQIIEFVNRRSVPGAFRGTRVLSVRLADSHCQGCHGNVHEDGLVGDGPDQGVASGAMGDEDHDRLGLDIVLAICGIG
jgi:hypothetical protein